MNTDHADYSASSPARPLISGVPYDTIGTDPMSLAEGAQLGSYEITGVLGAGAMGKVYRARDARLGREVALKILPGEFAANPDRRRRFEQEARAACALNHPNIVAVYDAGHSDGVSYIVYELVDGESLRDLIRRGPLSLRKTVELGAQIADGLAAAHETAITHRDLKPENIMLTRDGRPKILDFGLARYEPKIAQAEGTMTMTQPGMLLGTPGYMSPEQVAGKPADARADIFALGVILHELLTGKMTFERATSIETMSAILREDPPDLPANVPSRLAALVTHALEKEPGNRYQSAKDMAFALRDSLDPGSVAVPGKSAAGRRSRKGLAIAVVALAAIALYALAGLFYAPQGINLTTYRFTPIAAGAEPQVYPSWSPDGKSVAYMKSSPGKPDELMIRTLDSPVPVSVEKGDFQNAPLWSADGNRLFFLRRDGVYVVGRAGGEPQRLLAGDFAEAAISRDGQSLAVWVMYDSTVKRAKIQISSPPGSPLRVYEPAVWSGSGSTTPVRLRFSPDGRQLAVMHIGQSGPEFWLLPLPSGSGQARRVFQSAWHGSIPSISWMPDSRHLILSDNRLWLADTKSETIEPVTSGESDLNSAAVSPDGSAIAFDSLRSDWDLIEIPLDGSPMRPLLATTRGEGSPSWSPTGQQLAFLTDRTGHPEIWIKSVQEDVDRPVVTQRDFADDTRYITQVTFSFDGRRLAYMRSSSQQLAAIWISPATGGTPVRLTSENTFETGAGWSPDGNWIAYISSRHGLAKARVGAGQPPVSLRKEGCTAPAQWSPDGQWISCLASEAAYLVASDGSKSRRVSELAHFLAATWSKDGRLLVLGATQRYQWKLTSIDLKSGAERILSDLAEPRFSSLGGNWIGLSVAPDGKSVATSLPTTWSDVILLQGFPEPAGGLRRLWWPGR